MDGFFKWSDKHIDELHGTKLNPDFWWSRRYEYPFAMSHITPDDIILDAACGTYHPFKHAAAEICMVYACDLDICEPGNYQFIQADLTNLPYEEQFTKVFCISVLEHMNPDQRVKAIREFHRVLKPDGKLILTVDYPSCNLEDIYTVLKGFKTGEINMDMDNAISSTYFGGVLWCYHIIADKA